MELKGEVGGVRVYDSYAHPGTDVQAYWDRAWAGALTLILIVMILNLAGRLIARRSPARRAAIGTPPRRMPRRTTHSRTRPRRTRPPRG